MKKTIFYFMILLLISIVVWYPIRAVIELDTIWIMIILFMNFKSSIQNK